MIDARIEHEPGQDFGTLIIEAAGPDDDVFMAFCAGTATVRLPLFTYQAKEIVEALGPLLAEKEAE